MKHRALWNYNRYEVVRGVWKGVMVPGLTFGNAVLCMKSEVQSGLEIRQRKVGRLALGAHGNTPNEGVQGDMGWASFEVREAISKLKYDQRLTEMEESRWARKMYKHLFMKSLNTKWTNRTRKLRFKYLEFGDTRSKTAALKSR
uniref:Tick transposon n=1 Tax=Amblyomma maculatum TaxID=34609 RepID=G3MST8_AMBMU